MVVASDMLFLRYFTFVTFFEPHMEASCDRYAEDQSQISGLKILKSSQLNYPIITLINSYIIIKC